jgi:hypothetical protein
MNLNTINILALRGKGQQRPTPNQRRETQNQKNSEKMGDITTPTIGVLLLVGY